MSTVLSVANRCQLPAAVGYYAVDAHIAAELLAKEAYGIKEKDYGVQGVYALLRIG